MSTFKIGQVVELNTKVGPKMTVSAVELNPAINGGDVECIWFNKEGAEYKICKSYFNSDCILAHDESPGVGEGIARAFKR